MPVPTASRRRRVLLGRGRGAAPDDDGSLGDVDRWDDHEERAAGPDVAAPPAEPAPPVTPPRSARRADRAVGRLPGWLPFLTWPAGGAAGEARLRLTDTRTGERQSVRMAAPQLVIGADPHLHLVRGDLAPRHAAVQAVPGGVLVISAVPGGLTRAGEKTDAVLLRAGGSVALGPYELTARRVPDRPPGCPRPRLHQFLSNRPPDRGPADPHAVTVAWPGGSAVLGTSRPVLTVGSHRRAAVRTPTGDPLSALLLMTPDGPALAPLRSPAAARVDSRPARRTPLGTETPLTVGDLPVTITGSA